MIHLLPHLFDYLLQFTSLGYASDVTEIMKYLPKICQGFLMSATLSPELNSLKKVVLHSPAVLKLEEADDLIASSDGDKKDKVVNLTQLYLTLPKKDKNLVLYVFLKVCKEYHAFCVRILRTVESHPKKSSIHSLCLITSFLVRTIEGKRFIFC